MNELEGMTFHSAEREVERLERQLDEARQEADALRRQVAECQAELAAARLAIQAYAAVAAICPTCGGSGEVDSGGFSPWGDGIDATCPTCQGSGRAYITANTSHGEKEGDA